MALRRFTLRAAAGFRGREGGEAFARELLACFAAADASAEVSPDDGANDEGETRDAPVFSHRFDIVDEGKKTTRTLAAYWPSRRVVLEVVDRDALLDPAWQSLHRACLQMPEEPQYVVLTNQRDVRLYDLSKDRQAARLTIAIDELPKYSEAFVFFDPGWKPGVTPKIINVDKVSKEVADLVAKVYRALAAKHSTKKDEVTRFILQCIVAMFSEDIGLLPKEYFTTLLYRAGEEGDVEGKLAGLFEAMSTPDASAAAATAVVDTGSRAAPGAAAAARESGIPFFNGGLFKKPVTLPLDSVSLRALTKAAEANWTFVDPHIFGSVFQGIMDDAERHASGAHYTAREDILSVVGPTIVELWRERITAATTLTELRAILTDLGKYRVLDPACGSGNFLYVAFRELYKLETEVLCRIYEFVSAQKSKPSWTSNIRTTNFYGLDINPFAVELAKTTLNMAKKIAFEERKATVLELYEQAFLDVDPSLPLDNLDDNIVCADALFTEWPEVDAIVGNPPFLAGSQIRKELGAAYLEQLQQRFGTSGGDFCAFWFRRSHEELGAGGRAGLIGTSAIRFGLARETSLDFITSNAGVIVEAVSSKPWTGDAMVNVSSVNWCKGPSHRQHVRLVIGNRSFDLPYIAPHLQLHENTSTARTLGYPSTSMSEGVKFGSAAFEVSASVAVDLKLAARRIATSSDILSGRIERETRWVTWLASCRSERDAEEFSPVGYLHLLRDFRPEVQRKSEDATAAGIYKQWIKRWWQPWAPRREFFEHSGSLRRIIVCGRVQSRGIFALVSSEYIPTDTLQVFAFDDDYTFGVVQSSLHWFWTRAQGGRLKSDIRYTTNVWRTFPWPQDPSEADVLAVAEAARALRATRRRLMDESGASLRALYQSAEVAGPHPLKEAQAALDAAVDQAYGRPAGQEATEFLLELNLALAEDEAAGITIQGPGLPATVDPKDPRFTSTDCIEPPPFPSTDPTHASEGDSSEDSESGHHALSTKKSSKNTSKSTSTRGSSKRSTETKRGDDG